MHPLKKAFLALVMLMMLATSLMARAQSSPNEPLTVARLEQGMGRLFVAVEKAPNRAAKIQILENFHQALRREIRAFANQGVRNAVYWKAVDLDVVVTKLIDQNCAGLKESIATGEHNMIDNDNAQASAATQKALELAQLVCQ
ncbi:MAG: hypothetical protein KF681_04420 [Bdellovibrionaceae bacterium]|nr:hypothetical protein [Pseudobdellovibrionaceae bacterium]